MIGLAYLLDLLCLKIGLRPLGSRLMRKQIEAQKVPDPYFREECLWCGGFAPRPQPFCDEHSRGKQWI